MEESGRGWVVKMWGGTKASHFGHDSPPHTTRTYNVVSQGLIV